MKFRTMAVAGCAAVLAAGLTTGTASATEVLPCSTPFTSPPVRIVGSGWAYQYQVLWCAEGGVITAIEQRVTHEEDGSKCVWVGNARTRRERWMVSMPDHGPGERDFAERTAGHGPSPEDLVLARERRQKLAAALAKLPDRQRSVFMLSHYEGCTSREVSAITGLNESTVRVHLFRAIRKLRGMLTEATNGAS